MNPENEVQSPRSVSDDLFVLISPYFIRRFKHCSPSGRAHVVSGRGPGKETKRNWNSLAIGPAIRGRNGNSSLSPSAVAGNRLEAGEPHPNAFSTEIRTSPAICARAPAISSLNNSQEFASPIKFIEFSILFCGREFRRTFITCFMAIRNGRNIRMRPHCRRFSARFARPAQQCMQMRRLHCRIDRWRRKSRKKPSAFAAATGARSVSAAIGGGSER